MSDLLADRIAWTFVLLLLFPERQDQSQLHSVICSGFVGTVPASDIWHIIPQSHWNDPGISIFHWKFSEWIKPVSATVQILCCLVTKSCLTLCYSMDCISPGSSVHEVSQAGILEWVALSFSRGFSWQRDQTCVSCFGRQILYHWATREALQYGYVSKAWRIRVRKPQAFESRGPPDLWVIKFFS